jgi:hypothetical protein
MSIPEAKNLPATNPYYVRDPATNNNSEPTVLKQLYAIFGEVVLLPIPLRSKKPAAGWNTLTFDQTQAPAYQASLLAAVRRGGNIGCRAGEGLVFIDFDDAKLCREFENANLKLAGGTMQVCGKRGRQFVFRIKPGTWYPNTQAVYPIKGPDGKPCGEWRCGGGQKGAQSVVYGIHPDNVQYALGQNDIQTIDFAELKWPWGPFWETAGTAKQEPKEPTQKVERKERRGDAILKANATQTVEAFYDSSRKEYLTKNAAGRWHAYDQRQFMLRLRARGYPTRKPDEGLVSPAEEVILELQNHFDVQYAGPLAGRKEGFYEENGLRFLVTTSPNIIEARKGSYETLGQFVTNLLAGPDEPYAEQQWTTFLGWLKTARMALKAGLFQPGQALALAGEVEGGKSLLQQIITYALGGRSAKAAMFLQGRTDFNSELFGAEHLMLEDENASTDFRARRFLATAIKGMVANRIHPCHPKNRNIVNLPPFWRVSISLNDDDHHMQVLPEMNADMADKIILLRATKTEMPMPVTTAKEKDLFFGTLMRDLPGFLWWLENEFVLPAGYTNPRFGVAAYQHPELLEKLDELSPAFRLLDLIDLAEPWGPASSEWEGTADELRRMLLANAASQRDASKLLDYPTACGRYLGQLAQKRGTRVKDLRTGHSRNWAIYAP